MVLTARGIVPMHSIWAVAGNTIKQALRMKIAAVFVVLLIVLLPVMGLTVTGDGTVKGRLQTFISYGLSLTSLLLCLLTIIASTYCLTSDFDKKQIYTVLTKPVYRYQLLLGKLLGIVLLDIGLLVLFSGVIYTIVVCTPWLSSADPVEAASVKNEFFTARVGLKRAEPDVSQEVQELYRKLEKNQQLPAGVADDKRLKYRYMTILTKRKRIEKGAVDVGQSMLWEFENVRLLDPNDSLFIRFKYDVSIFPADQQVFGRWEIGDYRQVQYGGSIKTPIYRFDRKDLVRTFHEIQVPSDAVTDNGYLGVRFVNPPLNNTVVLFSHSEGLEVLYKAGTFTGNFIKCALLVLFRLVFLACLGILAGSFLSFPVAILFCLAIFFTASISGFCLESFERLSEGISGVYYYTLRPVIYILPRFDQLNPSKFLVPGRLVGGWLLLKAAGLMVCIRAFLLLLAAILVFSYREIARIII